MHFFNTIDEKNGQLEESRAKSCKQEELILAFFKLYPYESYTPFDIQKFVLPNCPITSVRRAMTVLEQAGKLEKTNVKRVEQWGKMNHLWKLYVKPQTQLKLFAG